MEDLDTADLALETSLSKIISAYLGKEIHCHLQQKISNSKSSFYELFLVNDQQLVIGFAFKGPKIRQGSLQALKIIDLLKRIDEYYPDFKSKWKLAKGFDTEQIRTLSGQAIACNTGAFETDFIIGIQSSNNFLDNQTPNFIPPGYLIVTARLVVKIEIAPKECKNISIPLETAQLFLSIDEGNFKQAWSLRASVQPDIISFKLDERIMENSDDKLPLSLCIGEFELSSAALFSLRPGKNIEFPMFETIDAQLMFGKEVWARGILSLEKDQIKFKLYENQEKLSNKSSD